MATNTKNFHNQYFSGKSSFAYISFLFVCIIPVNYKLIFEFCDLYQIF
jgi:hypothetical protein